MAKEITPEEQEKVDSMINALMERAKIASAKYMELDQIGRASCRERVLSHV